VLAERFRDSPVGSLVPITGVDPRFDEHDERFAFVPHPLPDRVELSGDTVAVVADAMLALGRVDRAGRQSPDRALLRPTLRGEAQATSALDGIHVPLTDVLEADPDDLPRRSPELAEVMNYVTAAEHAFATVPERRLSVRLILELHRLLVRGTSSDGNAAGRVRTDHVVIGASSTRFQDARFVPPPPGPALEAQLRDWVDWVNDPRPAMPGVVAAALAHYQFETMHPLNDGNGRIGRLLIVVHLLVRGVLGEPVLTISPWFEMRRADYRDELQRVSESGDFDRWVRFFATGIRDQADETTRKVDELVRLRDQARETCRANTVRGIALHVAEGLISRPIITPTWVQRNYAVSYPAANNAVTRLEELGLVRETTGGNYGRIYAADTVLRVLER
jgi:Fic family protein